MQAVRLLHPPGWAATAFDHAYAVHKVHTLLEDPAGLIAADLDASGSTYGPRHELLQFWEGGTASSALTARSRRRAQAGRTQSSDRVAHTPCDPTSASTPLASW